MADCCPPLPQPKNAAPPPEPQDGEEAKAKAQEMKGKEAEARSKAAAEGKPVNEASPLKPTPVSVPPTPKSSAKPGGAAPPNKVAAQKPPGPKPAPPQAKSGQKTAAPPQGGGKGGAGASAAASIDAEVAAYLKTAPKDESKKEISTQSKQLVDAAKSLKESAPPIEDKGLGAQVGDTLMGAGKMFIPGMDSIGAKPGESDLDKIMGKGENPYKDFNSAWGKRAQWLTRARDTIAGISSFLGKIGMVLTVVGIIISLTGIGAALGGPIATIGRVLGLITLVLDILTFAMSTALVAIGGILYKEEPDPAKRAKLAKNLISDANQSFNAAMGVVLALPGVQKLASVAIGGIKGIATGIISRIATKLGLKVATTALKGAAKFAVALIKKGAGKAWTAIKGGFSKVAGLFKGSGRPSAFGTFMGKLGTGAKNLVTGAGDLGMRGLRGIGGGATWTVNKAKELLGRIMPQRTGPGLMDRAKALGQRGWDATKRGYGRLEGAMERYDKWLNRVSGGDFVEKNLRNRMSYYTAKVAGGAEGLAARTEARVNQYWEERLAKVEGAEARAGTEAAGAETRAATQAGTPNTGRVAPPSEAEALLAKDRPLALAEGEANSARAAERRKLRDLERAGATQEELAAQRHRLLEAEQRLADARIAIQEQNAAKRAAARLDESRGGAQTSDRFKQRHNEWNDAAQYQDPAKSGFFGQVKEKVLEERERKLAVQSAMDANQQQMNQQSGVAQAHGAAGQAQSFADQWQADHPGPDAAQDGAEPAQTAAPGPAQATPGAAPSISALDPGSGSDLAGQVHSALGDLDEHDPADPAQQQQQQQQQQAPPTQGQVPPAQGQTPPGGAATDPAASNEAPPQPGTIPYWPELLTQYGKDITELSGAETMLQDYKKAQLSGYKKAVGIKDDAQKQKDTAKGRQPTQQQNIKDAQGDQAEFRASTTGAQKTNTETGKADSKKNEGSGAASEGGSAANADVPDPPAPSFWDRILNFFKKFLVNYIAKGLQYVQNAFANFILKQFAGVDLAALQNCANCTQQQNAQGSQAAQGAQTQTSASQQKDAQTQAKSQEAMTEAQQLQVKTQQNIAAADDLLGAIGRIKQLLAQEIQQGNQYLANLTAEKNKEKQAQEEAEKKRQAEEAARQQQQEQQQQQQQPGQKPAVDPAKVGRLRQAAQLVRSAATNYHQRAVGGFNDARGRLSGLGGEAGNKAAAVFAECGGEELKLHQQATESLVSKMGQVGGATPSSSEQLHQLAQQVTGAAGEADADLRSVLGSLKANFDACYQHAQPAAQQQQQAH